MVQVPARNVLVRGKECGRSRFYMAVYKLFVLPATALARGHGRSRENRGLVYARSIVRFEIEKGLSAARHMTFIKQRSAMPIWRARKRRTLCCSPPSAGQNGILSPTKSARSGSFAASQGYEPLCKSAPGDLLSGACRCLFTEARACRWARSHDRSRIDRGVYFGEPKQIIDLGNGQRRAIDTQVYDTYEIERSAHRFRARRKRRNKVTSSDKRNVMKSGVLWDEVIRALHAREYSDVELEHQLADALGMQLVRRPKQFDVIVTDNLFGDMLSDVASMLTGSLGMLPSARSAKKMRRARPASAI